MAHRGNWLKLHAGDRVYDVADPRHIGRLISIQHGYYVTVLWEDTGWLSQVVLNDLRKVETPE